MKFSILSTILAASTALAAPSSLLPPRQAACDQRQQPSEAEATGALRDWLAAVNTINAFVDNAARASSSAAAHALQFAKHEPNDLKVLSRVCGVSDAYTRAVRDLGQVFGAVLTNLQAVVDRPAAAPAAAATINRVRCCNVLPDLDVLWLEAAGAYGVVGQVQTDVPRPGACAAVQC
ncbi:hypothetical protein PG999_001442 [Apiospora kogelbergensis]|uniref:Uncharacterized protein n=1 Tax=Apiospora kogelbergensis TaxID=1337665 RepID=A0AAW0RET5_9PEZI